MRSHISQRANIPSKLRDIATFGERIMAPILAQPVEFTDSPALLQGLRESKIAHGAPTLLVIDAVTSRAQSANSAKPSRKHVKWRINFYLDAHNGSATELTGAGSLFVIRDSPEPIIDRGGDSPSEAKHALSGRPNALGIDFHP